MPVQPAANDQRPGRSRHATPVGDLSSITTVLWTICELVSRDTLSRSGGREDILDIKRAQAALEQVVSEIRDDVQTIAGTLPKTA